MLGGEHEVRLGVAPIGRHFRLGQLAPNLGGHAGDEGSRRDDRALEHDSARGDERLATDHGSVQDRRAHADEAVVFDDAAVQHRVVAHTHSAPDDRGLAGVAVHRDVVLQVGAFAHLDEVAVAPQYGSVEHRGLGVDAHLAKERRIRGDPRSSIHVRFVAKDCATHSASRSGWGVCTASQPDRPA